MITAASTARRRDLGSGSATIAGIVAVVAATTGVAVTAVPLLIIPGLVALGLAGLFVLPVRFLPVISLVYICFVPVEHLPVPGLVRHAPLWLAPIIVLMVRSGGSRRPVAIIRLFGALLIVGLIGVALLAQYRPLSGLAWTANAAIAVGAIAVVQPRAIDRNLLRVAFLAIGSALAVYAVIESFVLQANPLLDSLYAQGLTPLEQRWSSHRATTFLGHPLVNGTIFAVIAVLAFGRILDQEAHRHRGRDWTALGLLLVALGATQARASIAAAGLGMSILLLARHQPAMRHGRRSLLPLLVLITAGAALTAVVADRSASLGGERSVENRRMLPARTAAAVEGYWMTGVGPAAAELHRQRNGLPGYQESALESAYAQLLVAIGAPVAALFVALLLVVVGIGLRQPDTVWAAAGLLTLLVSIASYNALDAHQRIFGIIAVLLLMAIPNRGPAGENL